MRKVLLLLSLLVTLGLYAKETIKVGVVIPLSGSAAYMGEDIRDGIRMRVSQLEKANLKFNYQIIYEDSQNTPRLAAEAFKKLSEIDKVDAVVSFGSGPSSTISALAKTKGILHIGGGYAPSIVDGPLNFNTGPLPIHSAQKGIEYLQALGIKKVALLGMQHAGVNAVTDEFEKAIKAIKGTTIEIVSSQKFNPGERDFRVMLLKLRETKPEILLVQGFEPEVPIILRQLREIGYDVPISSIGGWGLVKDASVYGIPYVEPTITPQYTTDFLKTYKRKPQEITAFTVDSVALLVTAAERTVGNEKPTPQAMAETMQRIVDFDGYFGKPQATPEGWFFGPAGMIVKTPDGTQDLTIEQATQAFRQRWPSAVAK